MLATIAAGLQKQNVPISEFVQSPPKRRLGKRLEIMSNSDLSLLDRLTKSTDIIDNRYAAGLAGDLAEVCVYQGPYFGTDLAIGMNGTWNDTFIPRIR